MKISVIIPTYKPQTYLWECLDSLVAQTFPKEDFEVILVLNGCCQPYKSDIEAYINKHNDTIFHFIQTDVPGVSNARNIALDNAQGDYVAFIDDDDYVSPKYLEELYAVSSEDTIGLCYPYAFNDGEPQKQLPYGITDAYNKLKSLGKTKYPRARKFFSGPCMKLIPMSFIQGRRYDVRFKIGEDSLFMFLISDKMNKVDFTSEKAVYYRRIRNNSALFKARTKTECICNHLRSIRLYTKIYFSGNYNTYFYLTRIMAGCIGIMRVIIKGKFVAISVVKETGSSAECSNK